MQSNDGPNTAIKNQKEISFPSAISDFFRMFLIKILSKFIITCQISAAPNSHKYLILLVPFWKMMSFATKWIAFFGAKSPCFLPHLHSPTNAMIYADETLSFKDTAMQDTQ